MKNDIAFMKRLLLATIIFGGVPTVSQADEPITWDLWPGKAPGEVKELPPEFFAIFDRALTAGEMKRVFQLPQGIKSLR